MSTRTATDAKQAANKSLEIDAAEIRMRSERRLGQLIAEQKATVGLNRGLAGTRISGSQKEPVKDARPTLTAAGIDKKLSSLAGATCHPTRSSCCWGGGITG